MPLSSTPSFLVCSPEEDVLLGRVGPLLCTRERAWNFAEHLSAWLRHIPETESMLAQLDAGAWARLRAGQARHYQELLLLPYDEQRRQALHRLGAMHQAMGLPSAWLHGIYTLYLEELQTAALALPDLSAQERQRLRRAIRKRIELDRFWQMEGYEAASLDVLETQKRFYQVLAEIAALTSGAGQQETVPLLQEAARRVVEILDLALVWIGSLAPGDTWVEVLAAAGPAQEYANGLRVSSDASISEGQGPLGLAIRTGKVQIVADISQDWKQASFRPWKERAERFGVGGSMVAVAPREDGGVLTLSLYRRTGSAFSEGVQHLVVSLVQELAAFWNRQSLQARLQTLQSYREAQRHLQQELLGQPDSQHIFHALASNLIRFADTEGVDVLLSTPESPVLERLCAVGPMAEYVQTLPTPQKKLDPTGLVTLPALAWSTRSPKFRQHPAQDLRLPDRWRQEPLASIGAVGAWPVQLAPDAEPVAVVVILARRADTFSPELQQVIGEMIQATALALQQDADRRALAQLTALYQALMAEGELLLRAGDERHLLRDTCHRLVESGLFIAAWIGQPDPEGHFFRYLAASGPGSQALQQLRIPVENPGDGAPALIARAWQSGKIQFHQDHLADQQLRPWRNFLLRYGWRSAAAVPIRRDGKRWAILVVIGNQPEIFRQALLELLSRIADILGHGLAELDLREALRQERDRQQYLALHDPLTDLPNRAYFQRSGQEALARARREQKPLAIGVLDLDGFKQVNDVLGHGAGDRLLQSIARRLQSICRGGDVVTRLGGDEFGLHLSLQDREDLTPISERMLMAVVSAAAAVTEMPISASLGWAIFPEDGEDFDSLFAHADDAMYAAKDAGKSTFRVYGGAVSQLSQRRIWVHQHFPRAIASGAVQFFLQAQADILAGKLIGVEMLARWREDHGRWQSPGKFIATVEEDIHLIRGLGVWGMQEADRFRQRFRAEGLDLGISLNIGARHFLHPAFLDDLDEHCPEGRGITLEITESVALADLKTSAALANAIKDRGFRLSMDDFGTGYSSLMYAAKLPFDELKLDQDFVRNFGLDQASFAVAGAARLLSELSGLSLIAEGIASPTDLSLWMQMGGSRIQGYHLSPPLPENAFFTWYSWLLPLPRSRCALCPLEDLALLIHSKEDPRSRQYTSDTPLHSCPLSTWFAQKEDKYGCLPSFALAKGVHDRLHQLTQKSTIQERVAVQKQMRALAQRLCRELAAREHSGLQAFSISSAVDPTIAPQAPEG
ncbi:MAG: EAL domain-containing protein [Acidithiobacillus sp.]|nr:EAL domain-containing protein [Acidithiobacillus sp.]